MSNNSLQIKFLGTGTSQGVPVIGCHCQVCLSENKKDKRLRTSVLIRKGDKTIVVDIGPDFRQQMLRAGVQDLDAVLITHEHNDHVAGLDDIRPFNFKYWKDMPVFAAERVQMQLKKRFSYVFSENPYPGAPMIQLNAIEKDQGFTAAGISILPIEVMHGSLPVLGFRIDDFVYLTDVKTISMEEKRKAKHAKVLVLSALHRKAHHSHLSLNQAIELIGELAPERAFLTHLSHQMGLHEKVSELLPENVSIAYDGLELEV
ncbi:MAG: MBL fold metallo-hydrolase [Bacteroidota bacterium]